MAIPFYIPNSNDESSFALHPHQHFLVLVLGILGILIRFLFNLFLSLPILQPFLISCWTHPVNFLFQNFYFSVLEFPFPPSLFRVSVSLLSFSANSLLWPYTFSCPCTVYQFSSVAQSSLTLQSHGLKHTRLPCPSPTPGACSNSCPLSRWCHPTIFPSVVPFSRLMYSNCLKLFASHHGERYRDSLRN